MNIDLVNLSKSQWEAIGKEAGWIKMANYEEKMMPGQSPYTQEEKGLVNSLVSDAAHNDPGEVSEDDEISRKRSVVVTMSDGDEINTEINGTKKEVTDYYLNHDFIKADEVSTHRGIDVKFVG
jgi:hypothetical protein